MVVACLALFVAIGGSSYAAIKLKPNSVKTKNIHDAAVTAEKIAPGAVGGDKLAPGSVGGEKIAKSAVNGSKIADGSVGKAKFASSGFAHNDSAFIIPSGVCSELVFDAPGVLPGDVAAINLAPNANTLFIAPGDGTIAPGRLHTEVCNESMISANISVGALTIGWVAFR